MKINQVEELVGITKKNIRFYEEQGLLNPERNPENGYREYNLKDVEELNKIKLFRKLSIPIEEIKRLKEGKVSFDTCMEEHLIRLNHEQHNLELVKELCRKMIDEIDEVSELKAEQYLDQMRLLEERGTTFMDITHEDVIKKKIGPIIAAVSMLILTLAGAAVLLYVHFFVEKVPIPALLMILVPTSFVVIGIVAALIMRMKEIDGGEEYEASKY